MRQSERLELYHAAAAAVARRGAGVRCDCTPEEVEARTKAQRPSPATTATAATGPRPGEARASCASAPPTRATPSFDDVIRGEVAFAQRHARGLRDPALQRHADVPARQRGRRRRHGHHPCDPGRGPLNVTPKVLLLREALGADDEPGVRPPAADRQRAAPEALEAARRRRPRGLPRPRLPARGDAQLPRAARVGPGRRRRDPARSRRSSAEFRLEDVTTSPAFFDLKKLDHINGEYIRALPCRRFVERAEPWLDDDAAWPPERVDPRFDAMAPGAGAGADAGRGRRHGRLLLPRRAGDRRGVVGRRPWSGQPTSAAVLDDAIGRRTTTCAWQPRGAARASPRRSPSASGLKLGKAQAPDPGRRHRPHRRPPAVRVARACSAASARSPGCAAARERLEP